MKSTFCTKSQILNENQVENQVIGVNNQVKFRRKNQINIRFHDKWKNFVHLFLYSNPTDEMIK